MIGHIENESQAIRFREYLFAKGIESQIEQEPPDRWAVWVVSEDDLTLAETELVRFRMMPEAPEFEKLAHLAREKRQVAKAAEVAAEKRTIDRDQLWPQRNSLREAPLTAVLILMSIFVAILSKMGSDTTVIQSFFISKYEATNGYAWWQALVEIQQGEVWRIFTPIFIHFGILHILFNMMWLRDLGGMIEVRLGSLRLALMIAVIAGLSNIAQYAVSGPLFGGMSGIVYGLLGYVWMKGKFDPDAGMRLHKQTVTMMIVWFFLCLFGIIPNVANAVHGVGLAIGMGWGYVSALTSRK